MTGILKIKRLLFIAIFTISLSSFSQTGFIGEIRMFAGNYPPLNWEFCQGQVLLIQDNPVLYSILGTTYGGNGTTTFALPDLRGRVVMGSGSGPGLTTRILGAVVGSETNALGVANLPPHSHSVTVPASSSVGTTNVPAGNFLANTSAFDNEYAPTSDTSMASFNSGSTGNGTPVNNIQPSVAINYIICVSGDYPQRH